MIRLAFLVVAPIVALFAFGEGPQQEYVNAGVLPYSRESGEVRVLLGFDPDPGAWADFVGVCTPGETPSDTAAREFVEETREAYPANDVLTRLRSLEPVEIGPTRIFLLEVPEIPAARLNRLDATLVTGGFFASCRPSRQASETTHHELPSLTSARWK